MKNLESNKQLTVERTTMNGNERRNRNVLTMRFTMLQKLWTLKTEKINSMSSAVGWINYLYSLWNGPVFVERICKNVKNVYMLSRTVLFVSMCAWRSCKLCVKTKINYSAFGLLHENQYWVKITLCTTGFYFVVMLDN